METIFANDTKCLENRGERVEIRVETREDLVQCFFENVPINDAILIWSENHPDWQASIKSIKSDPNAGQFQRGHPIELKRTRTTRSVMEEVLKLIKQECLYMEAVGVDGLQPQVTPAQVTNLEHWRSANRFGKSTLEVLPYAFDWLNRENQRIPQYVDANLKITSDSGTHLVHLGKINFVHSIV